MSNPIKVAVIIGSLRKESWTRKLALAIEEIGGGKLAFDTVPIGDLPFYNEEIEPSPPAAWVAFRDRIRGADAVLFATPEYNRSVPGVLKNAIDVGSRPYGKSVWMAKPAAVISNSPGAIGGFGANHHLRQSLVFLQMAVLSHEAYIGGVNKLFGEDGKLNNDGTRKFLTDFVDRFIDWIGRNKSA